MRTLFSGKTLSSRLIIALAAAVLYGLLNWAFSSLHLPGAPFVSLRPQVFIPITIGLMFGPVPGFITGFIGNIGGDLLSGFGFTFWDWSIGNGLIGVIPGLFFLKRPGPISTVTGYGLVLLAMLVANLVGLATGSLVDSLILQRVDFSEAVLEWFLPGLLTNVLLVFVLVPLALLIVKLLVLTLETRVIMLVTMLLVASIMATTTILVSRIDSEITFIVGIANSELMQSTVLDMLRWAGLASVIILLIGSGTSIFMVRRLTSPVSTLCAGAAIIGSGDYRTDAIAPVAKRKDELGELARTFQTMVENLKIQMEELKETTTARERIESELRVATDIQYSMLPRTFPPFPDRRELDIYAVMQPARQVGGDFYDFFFIEDHTLCLIIGDVCGKGVPAALFMAISKTLLRTEALRGTPPGDALSNVNNLLYAENDLSMFFTGFCIVIDTVTGKALYANGGHNLPLLSKNNEAFEFISMPGGLVVGAMPDIKFKTHELQLQKNDILFMYTDGVTEAMDAEERLYSNDSLKECLSGLTRRDPESIIRAVRADMEDFIRGTPQSDDITMLAFRFNGK
jgi:serine phosphatase RsbU (regulator of sigma subunit)/uncharacterized membrane protein